MGIPTAAAINRLNRKIRDDDGELRLATSPTGSLDTTATIAGNEVSLGSAQYFNSSSPQTSIEFKTAYRFMNTSNGNTSSWYPKQLVYSNAVYGVSSNRASTMTLNSNPDYNAATVKKNFYFRDTNPSASNAMGSNYHGDAGTTYTAGFGLPWFNEVTNALMAEHATIPSGYTSVQSISQTVNVYYGGQNFSTGINFGNTDAAFGSWASGSDGEIDDIQIEQCFWFKDTLTNTTGYRLDGYYGGFCLGIIKNNQATGVLSDFDYVVVNDLITFEVEAADKHATEPQTLQLHNDPRAALMWTINQYDFNLLNNAPSGAAGYKIEFFKKNSSNPVETRVVDKSIGHHYGKIAGGYNQVKMSDFYRRTDADEQTLIDDDYATSVRQAELSGTAFYHMYLLSEWSGVPSSGEIRFSDFKGTHKPLWAAEITLGQKAVTSCFKNNCSTTYYYGYWPDEGSITDITPHFLDPPEDDHSQGELDLEIKSVLFNNLTNSPIRIEIANKMLRGKQFNRVSIIDPTANILVASGDATLGYVFPTSLSGPPEYNSRIISNTTTMTWSGTKTNPAQFYNASQKLIVVLT